MSDDNEDDYDPHVEAAMQRATAESWEQVYNADSNEIYKTGVKNIPGFEQRVDHLKASGIMSPPFIELLRQCDNPPRVLEQLGSEEDLSAYQKLNPVQMMKVLAAVDEGRAYKPPKTSTPAWRQSRNDPTNETLTDAQFSKAWDRKYLGKGR
jgi:hypothetical protein